MFRLGSHFHYLSARQKSLELALRRHLRWPHAQLGRIPISIHAFWPIKSARILLLGYYLIISLHFNCDVLQNEWSRRPAPSISVQRPCICGPRLQVGRNRQLDLATSTDSNHNDWAGYVQLYRGARAKHVVFAWTRLESAEWRAATNDWHAPRLCVHHW